MKRTTPDDNPSICKKLKFGVDTILGTTRTEPILSQIEPLTSTNSPMYSHEIYSFPSIYGQYHGRIHYSLCFYKYVCLFVDHSYENSGLFLPSSMSNFLWSLDFRNKTRPRMLRRAVFTDQQRKGLELAFLKQKYISKPERKKLAQHLNLKDSQVKIW